MRTEVKIAAVIVIVLVAIGAIWYVGWGWKASQKAPDELGKGELAKTENDDRMFIADEGTSSGTESTEGTSSSESTEGTVAVGMATGEESTGAESTTGTSGTEKTATESTARAKRPWWEHTDRFPARIVRSEESTPPSARTAEVSTAEAGTAEASGTETTQADRYVVKDGDTYWSIARNLYGEALLYNVLEEANPKIPARSLRPGMTIAVPPKPPKPPRRAPTREPKTKHGTTVVDAASGKRYYIVKHGDSGFWGVSRAVFGTGRHMGVIQKLNPKLDTRALQPGQKILVPKEAPKLARRTSPAPGTGTRFTPRRTTPMASAGVVTGAPTRTVLLSGEVFD